MKFRCAHCSEPIESFNGYDYVTRGVSWRHEKTRERHCRTTMAAPIPEAATSLLRPDVDDPNGTVTCVCGEVFTGANFADRMSQWREHTEAAHAY